MGRVVSSPEPEALKDRPLRLCLAGSAPLLSVSRILGVRSFGHYEFAVKNSQASSHVGLPPVTEGEGTLNPET